MKIDESAADRIKELEADLEDAFVTIDIQQEVLNEQEELIRSMKAQIRAIQNAQKVNYGVA